MNAPSPEPSPIGWSAEAGDPSGQMAGGGELRRVVLIAGLEDGRMAARFLLSHPRVDLVGLVVLDEETGAGYSGYTTFDDLGVPVHETSRIRDSAAAIEALGPDLILVVGFSQIIPEEILSIPPLGVVGFHGARLPERRGCSPLIWAMVEGLTESEVTMLYLDAGIDTGEVIDHEAFSIHEDDQAADVLDKANHATLALLRRQLGAVLDGRATRAPQDASRAGYTRRRTPADAEIDWLKPAREIVDLVRALSPPYPLAHTFGGDGVPVLIEKARLGTAQDLPPSRFAPAGPFGKRVLCIVAHPDDEVLGVGGTLARHTEAGGRVAVLILSEGEQEKLEGTPRSETRRESALKAAAALGTEEVLFEDFPDQRLDSVPFVDLIKPIERAITRLRPQVVYTHHGGDANTDHQIVFRATYAACRPMSQVGSSVERLLTFETPSSTDQAPQVGDYVFAPNSFVDIGSTWERKLEALSCYPTEMIGGIHPRSYEYIEALARMRGGYGGVRLAEAFVLVRERFLL